MAPEDRVSDDILCNVVGIVYCCTGLTTVMSLPKLYLLRLQQLLVTYERYNVALSRQYKL